MEHFAVIDGSLVWHGGMNLLGKEDARDNLIRVKDRKAASELLEMSFGDWEGGGKNIVSLKEEKIHQFYTKKFIVGFKSEKGFECRKILGIVREKELG